MLDHTGTVKAAKLALRDQLLAGRRRIGLLELGERARASADHLLALPEVRRAATVAAYVSVGHEPGTGPLLDRLHDRGVRVLLPLLQPDGDLDWAAYAGAGDLRSARRGMLEPGTASLGPDAVAGADVVLVPGLAVGRDGTRMGRGGGSYDRALARVPVGTLRCVLLHRGELLDAVPAEPHDLSVDAVVTDEGVVRLPLAAGGA